MGKIKKCKKNFEIDYNNIVKLADIHFNIQENLTKFAEIINSLPVKEFKEIGFEEIEKKI